MRRHRLAVSAAAGATAVPALLGLLGLGLLCGCGGGLPLLHPARTLPAGQARASGGFSGTIALGTLSDAIRNAESDPNGGGVTGDTTFAKGALVAASVGPGLSPLVSARVGVGWQSEGGLAYTGRAIRADIRRSFDLSTHWALSIGAGGSAALYGHQDGSTLEDVSLNQLHGWGADVPLLVGYQSTGDIYMVWLGARGGGEHVDISDVTSEPKAVTLGSPPVGLSATRYWGGGLLGFAVGFRHVHVALELDASYATITGTYAGTSATVAGVTLAPATALWWDF
ncbi:MAG TPA: hypothetical protein VIY73_26745 [Polyangiaceae bacterium]